MVSVEGILNLKAGGIIMLRNIANDPNYYFSMPNVGLGAYFGNVRRGQPEIYTAPFAGDEKMDEVLDQWVDRLSVLSKTLPGLFQYELEMRSKVGPLSVMKPLHERINDINQYFDCVVGQFQPVAQAANAAVIREWNSARGLCLRSQWRTAQKMKLSTNSGSPYFTKRRKVVKRTIPVSSYHVGENVYQQLIDTTWTACAILGWRGQEGGDNIEDVKQRVVWMFPFGVNVNELQFYQPAIEVAQKFNINPAWISMDAVDNGITGLMDTKNSKDPIICTDFTKFDQHFNYVMQDSARSIIAHILTHDIRSEEWLNSIFPIKYEIPMAYNMLGQTLYLKYGSHGMGSGSGGTNFDESLAHRALQYEVAIKHGKRLNPYSQCLGDDGVLTFPGITVDKVIESYTSHGQEMNVEKQSVNPDECIYLRRWHSKYYRMAGRCVGVYPTTRALGRLRYLERRMDPSVWDAKAVALRQLSILENIKYHPMREEFVDFCMKRDKYRLGIDIPHFFDSLDREVQRVTQYMPDFLGYTRSNMSGEAGINDWWIVKYLKSKA